MAAASLSSLFSPIPRAGPRSGPALAGAAPLRLRLRPTPAGSLQCHFPSTSFAPRDNPKAPSARALTVAAGGAPTPLIGPTDHWGMWTVLLSAAAFGIWSEKTRIGSALSGAIVSTMVGSSVVIISADAPAFGVVQVYLLPMAIPLLLFNADLRRVVRSRGRCSWLSWLVLLQQQLQLL